MRKSLAAAMAALTFGGAIAASAVPAQARDHDGRGGGWRGGYDRDYRRNDNGAAIVAGIAGLVIGAALADGGHSYVYNRSAYYPRGDYAPGYYGYAPAYRVCEGSHWAWDRYARREVLVRDRYAC